MVLVPGTRKTGLGYYQQDVMVNYDEHDKITKEDLIKFVDGPTAPAPFGGSIMYELSHPGVFKYTVKVYTD